MPDFAEWLRSKIPFLMEMYNQEGGNRIAGMPEVPPMKGYNQGMATNETEARWRLQRESPEFLRYKNKDMFTKPYGWYARGLLDKGNP